MPPIAIALFASLLTADADFGWPDSITFAAQDAAELPDPQRLRTLERLTARAGERALPVLVPLLADRDPSVRLFAARRLGRAGSPRRHRGRDPLDFVAQRPARRSPVRPRRAARGAQRSRTPPARPSSARFATRMPPSASPPSTRWSGTTPLPSLPAVLSALDDDSREVRLRAVRLVAGKRDAAHRLAAALARR